MELNREQIIKALERCLVESNCTGCPLHHQYETDCLKYAGEKALSLIKELTEENESLSQSLANTKSILANCKTDTVRKMQEKLKGAFNFGHTILEKSICDIIDQIAKEMLEGTI